MFTRIFAFLSTAIAFITLVFAAWFAPGPGQLPTVFLNDTRVPLTSAEWTNNNGRPWSHSATTPSESAFTVAPNAVLVLRDSPSWPCPRTVTVTMRNAGSNANVAVRTAACGNPMAPQTRGQFIVTITIDYLSFNNWMGNGRAVHTLRFTVA